MKATKLWALTFSLLMSSVCLSPLVTADDTEIFYGQSSDAANTNPNILFILDTSGSMGAYDGGDQSRMDRMKQAMRLLLDQSSSYNVGFMGFSGTAQGGSIRFPIADLEAESAELCPGGICADETIVVRPANSSDDATQLDSTNVVTTDSPSLSMPIVPPTTLITGPVGTEISNTAVAVSSTSEAENTSTGALTVDNDMTEDVWFFAGPANDYSRFGYRFENIQIPPGATVTSAKIVYSHTGDNKQKGDISVYISAEATPNPTAYDDGSSTNDSLGERFETIRTTNELVSWTNIAPATDGSNPAVGQQIETNDIKGILTELAGLPGWQSGNAVSILLEPFESYTPNPASIRKLYGVSAAANLKPTLHYTYSETATTDLNTTVLEAAAHVDEITVQNSTTTRRNTANSVSNLFYSSDLDEPRKLALRFDGSDIPAGAVIKTARLTIKSAAATALLDPDSDWLIDPTTIPTTPIATVPITTPTTPIVAAALPDATAVSYAININAELSGTPLPYSMGVLADRAVTAKFRKWPDIDDTADTLLVSPDFADVIDEVVSEPTWGTGQGFSLILTAPATNSNVATNVRKLLTSTGDTKPQLTITWEEGDDGSADVVATQTTALRFPNVHVPPNATIKSAKLVFRSDEAGDSVTTIDISGEDIGNSAAITTNDNDIGARSRTTAREIWAVETWPTIGGVFDSPDISRVIEEITERSDWCGGNALTLFLKGDGSTNGFRKAISYDQNPIQAPSLEIVYEPDSVTTDSYCSNSSVVVSLVDAADDAVENTSNNAVSLVGPTLSTNSNVDGSGDAQKIGFRFRGVKVPKDSVIVSAALELSTTVDVTDSQNLTIQIEDEDHAASFQPANANISARNFAAQSVNWTSGPVAAGESAFTADLTPLISSVVNRAGWVSGNAMAFVLEGASAAVNRSFHAIDTSEASAARLIIYYQSERSDAGTRNRDNLKREVDSLVAQGGTPIVDAYYEAAQYFRGGELTYGLKRGKQQNQDRYHRVSHPSSYINGEVNRSSSCTDADLDSWDCRTETIQSNGAGQPTYISPIESQCQQNHIVLLSDGEAQSISSTSSVQALMADSCTLNGTGSSNNNEMCGRELAKWLFENDHSASKPEKQNVVTHTIGFNISDPKFLQDIASEGKGKFYPATSSAELLTAFKNIFINVSKTDTSFVAPSATVSQANRMKHREDVYYSLFKPEGTARWAGNLKKYKLRGVDGQNAVLYDAKDDPAIDPATGEFKTTSRSFWSGSNDGGSVLIGGAAAEIERDGESHLNRNVYTYTGFETKLKDISNELLPGNPDLDPSWFELPPMLAADPDYYTDLVNWLHGQDIQDIDGDGDTMEARGQMGDPLHSQPLLLNYADGTSIVYLTTNEGYLHAVDHESGREEFAFMPKELLKNATRFYDNSPTRNRPYGLDGGITTWIKDDDNNGLIDPGEKAYLYIAMRRGGNNYYAIDVSNYNDPEFMWTIKGGETTIDTDPTTADGDFEELSDTWSLPVRSKVRDGGNVRDVLIFGAGYDPNQDPASSTTVSAGPPTAATGVGRRIDGVGRGIFIVDALSGDELWQTDGSFNDLFYSIPSQVRVIDINLDGLADQLYVGDMGGQIWRFDIDNNAATTEVLSQRVTGGVIAKLAEDDVANARRFYYPPDVSIINTGRAQELAISIGSGWRAHPLNTIVEDRFYSIRYKHVYTKPIDSKGNLVYSSISENELQDITANTPGTPLQATAQGWYLKLDQPGEKVLGGSVTADGNILFTSYLPASTSGVCSAAVGSGAVYAVSAKNGDPVLNLDGVGDENYLTNSDRRRQLKHAGIPPETAVLFPSAGEATVLVGTETLDEIDVGEPRRRTFWQEALEDNL